MNNNPFFSVIIPVYNRAELLEEALQSVRAQDFTDFEIIVADDGSTDESAAVAKKYADKYLELPHSGMPGLVRNRGAEIAEGEFLAFLDSDDLWESFKLTLQYKKIQEFPELNLVHTREVWDRNGKEVSQKGQKHQREGDIFIDALVKCIIGPSTTVIRRSIFNQLGGFREDLEIAEDYELWLRFCSKYSVGYIDSPCIVKRAGGWDQLSEKYGMIEKFRIDALRDLVLQRVFPVDKQIKACDVLVQKIEIFSKGALKRGRVEEVELLQMLRIKILKIRGEYDD